MKNKKRLTEGLRIVFCFTAKQSVKSKSFKGAAIGVFLLIFALFFGLNMLMMIVTKDERDNPDNPAAGDEYPKCEYSFDKIYICNGTPFKTDISSYKDAFEGSFDRNINVEEINKDISAKDIEDMAKADPEAGYILIYEDSGMYKINYYEQRGGDSDAANVILDISDNLLRMEMIEKTGINPENLSAIYAFNEVDVYKAGESRNMGVFIIKMLMPMLLCLGMYMLVIMNGQSITKAVIAEKSSKLMEMLLTSLRPYEIIAGKVLGMASVALLQTLLWIIAGVTGFITGDSVAKMITPSYENKIIDVFNVIKENAQDAFSPTAVILAVIFVIAGFLFYCVFAAMTASMLSKAEDLQNASAMFQIPMVIAFLAAYIAPMLENEQLLTIVRICPITSPFSIPSDIISGNVSVSFTLASLLLLIILTAVLTVFTGKLYKSRIFGKK